jgi:hypothetical protein
MRHGVYAVVVTKIQPMRDSPDSEQSSIADFSQGMDSDDKAESAFVFS